MRFKTPNVIIAFSNMYPDTREFSEDRWLIFKINSKMMLEEVTTEKIKKKEEVKDAQKSYMDWQSDSDHGYDADWFQKKYKRMDNKIKLNIVIFVNKCLVNIVKKMK